MLSYINGFETAAVVLHEIYGVNRHINDVCGQLAEKQMDVFAPNLLKDEMVFDSCQAELAYDYFYKHTGMDTGYKRITELLVSLRQHYRHIILIGYSVGAALAWLCSQEEGLCDAVVGFYGSRIRDYTEITVRCPVLLFFPEEEKAFNVAEIIELLKPKENVTTIQLTAKHGFANPESPEYSKTAAEQAYRQMTHFINVSRGRGC